MDSDPDFLRCSSHEMVLGGVKIRAYVWSSKRVPIICEAQDQEEFAVEIVVAFNLVSICQSCALEVARVARVDHSDERPMSHMQ